VRTARNIAIIVVLAVPVAFVPGGGQVARGILVALMLAFLATLGLAARQVYRENRLTIDTLPDVHRAELLVACGVLVLMIAGADELLDSGLGTVLWIALVAISALTLARVWHDAHAY
jgi:hypothetical protein